MCTHGVHMATWCTVFTPHPYICASAASSPYIVCRGVHDWVILGLSRAVSAVVVEGDRVRRLQDPKLLISALSERAKSLPIDHEELVFTCLVLKCEGV